MAYLNANATTPMYKRAAQLLYTLYRRAINIHADDSLAASAATNVKLFKDQLTSAFGFDILFVSGASEANSLAIQSFADKNPTGTIATTPTEHSGVLKSVSSTNLPIIYLPHNNNIYDETSCHSLLKHMPDKPLLVCIIHGNNESGHINKVADIARAVKRTHPRAHVHVDASQTFCKVYTSRDLFDAGVDTVTVSFHKVRGPHLGLLMYRDAGAITPSIHGSQQNGLRGGTLSAPLISAAYYAYVKNMSNIKKDCKLLRRHRADIIGQLCAGRLPVVDVLSATVSPDSCLHTDKHDRVSDLWTEPHIEIFSKSGETVLPNTILMIVYDPSGHFCNIECKQYLNQRNVIIGIGSACLTGNSAASHVTDAYKLNTLQKRGILRLSYTAKLKNREYAIKTLLDYIHGQFKGNI
jgi:cysteine sulfinate desulfinase/cysteine desulfurase-like protein